MSKSQLKVMKLRIGNTLRDVYLRDDTTDSSLTGQIFVDNALHMSEIPRSQELNSWLEQCRARSLRPLMVDAGANIGLSSICLSAQVPDALIVALEPEAMNHTLLVANTQGLPVLPLPAALDATPGEVILDDPGEGEWAYRTQKIDVKEKNKRAIPAVTIDEIFTAHEAACAPFAVKIDIEGAEEGVFDCSAEWVDRTPLIIVELHDWMLPRARSAQPVLRRLVQSDRDFVIRGENLFSMAINLPEPTTGSFGDTI